MLRLASLLLVLSAGSAVAEDWPGWRGPRRDGTADKAEYPTKWTAKDGVKWKRAIPGVGHSSPVVVAGKVFLTSCLENVGDEKSAKLRMLLCYDRATGEQLWAKECLSAPLEGKHKLNSHASSTPVSDGERIYVPFAEGSDLRVFCYDLAGKKLWDATPGEFHSVHGFCSSPMLFKDLLIVNGDHDPDGCRVPGGGRCSGRDGAGHLIGIGHSGGLRMGGGVRPGGKRPRTVGAGPAV